MKHRIVWPSDIGPAFYEWPNFDAMAACLMTWLSMGAGVGMNDATAWKFKYGKWQPVWPWMNGVRP